MDPQDAAPATKGDLRGLRQELKSDIRSLALEIVKNSARMDRLEESLNSKFTEGISKMLQIAEGFLVQVQKVDRDQIITRYRVDELEKRVKTLEAT